MVKAIPGHPRDLALFVNNRGAEINPSRGRLFEGRLALAAGRINAFRRGMKIIRLTLELTGPTAAGTQVVRWVRTLTRSGRVRVQRRVRRVDSFLGGQHLTGTHSARSWGDLNLKPNALNRVSQGRDWAA